MSILDPERLVSLVGTGVARVSGSPVTIHLTPSPFSRTGSRNTSLVFSFLPREGDPDTSDSEDPPTGVDLAPSTTPLTPVHLFSSSKDLPSGHLLPLGPSFPESTSSRPPLLPSVHSPDYPRYYSRVPITRGETRTFCSTSGVSVCREKGTRSTVCPVGVYLLGDCSRFGRVQTPVGTVSDYYDE